MANDLIPDASKWPEKIHAGIAVMSRIYPFLGVVWIGCALVVAGSLTLAPDVLHHVLGLPASVKLLDYRSVWLASGVAGLFYSVWALGDAVTKKASQFRFKADDERGKAIQSLLADRDNLKVEAERHQRSLSDVSQKLEECERERIALNQALASRQATPTNVSTTPVPSGIGIIKGIRIIYQHEPSLYRCECDVEFNEVGNADPVQASPKLLLLTASGGQPEFATLVAVGSLPVGSGMVTYKGEADGGALLRRHMVLEKDTEGCLPVELHLVESHRAAHQKSRVKLDFELAADLVPDRLPAGSFHRETVHVASDHFSWPEDLNSEADRKTFLSEDVECERCHQPRPRSCFFMTPKIDRQKAPESSKVNHVRLPMVCDTCWTHLMGGNPPQADPRARRAF
jgi:hypothetical protein